MILVILEATIVFSEIVTRLFCCSITDTSAVLMVMSFNLFLVEHIYEQKIHEKGFVPIIIINKAGLNTLKHLLNRYSINPKNEYIYK